MDAVRANPVTDILDIMWTTPDAFVPVLEQRRAEIEKTKRVSFRYGSHSRHELDVYYPAAGTTNGKVPVLVFIYGGGMNTGWKTFPPPRSICYSNLGAFFAQQGIVTVIADYRLVPEAAYPDPIVDLRDAIVWLVSHQSEVNVQHDAELDFERITVMSHSVGSMYCSTLMLHPDLLPMSVRARLRGLILQAGVYNFTPEEPALEPPVLHSFYGPWEQVREVTPVVLLARAPKEILDIFPEVLIMRAEREMEDWKRYSADFAEMLKQRLERDVPISIMKEHNHMSPHWAAFSGDGEEWAYEVSAWIKEKISVAAV